MPNNQFDVTKVKIIPERTGPNRLTQEYPKLSGFLQGLMGRAPDEVGGGSVLDEDAQSSRKLQALGAKYGFPIGTIAGMLPFGGGIAKAPSVVAGSRTAQKGIVKRPGGNWLSGSPENAVRGLKRDIPDPTLDGRLTPEALDKLNAVNSWIDSQLVKKYIKNEMATERDPIRLMADAWPEKKAAKLAEVQARIDALAERTRQLAIERGQPEHTLVEMRQMMIPLEKEKALIEATEGLHYTPDVPMQGAGNTAMVQRRTQGGFPAKGLAASPGARAWEAASDRVVLPESAGSLLTREPLYTEADPWLLKVPPEVSVNRMNSGLNLENDLGFGHLIDELRNSLNPESGLPKELLLKYQDLPKVTVPQAAERVAQINAWRAAQKAEADLLTANNAATVLHKDYPEKGLKWVEMKAPAKAPEGWKSSAKTPNLDPDFEYSESVLKDALKYEGDQMAHCVGGYCPDVLEGRSRIFSLRDAKGKPHTTIEVAPGGNNPEVFSNAEAYDEMYAAFNQARKQGFQGDVNLFIAENYTAQSHPIIKQIKGYRNQRPDDEYLPYVQDFVKSGKWSDVGDLHNTGLRKTRGAYRTDQELIDEINSYGREQATPENLNELLKYYNFADGGLVNVGYNPDAINTRAAQLMEELGL